jgi:small subunit ribosomal protein S1
MSDQVKTVAAEDAPNNAEGGEAIVSTQTTSEQPEAVQAECANEIAPVAEAEPVAESAPVTENEPDADESTVPSKLAESASTVTSAVTSAVSTAVHTVTDAAVSAASALTSAIKELGSDADTETSAAEASDTETGVSEIRASETGASEPSTSETSTEAAEDDGKSSNVRILSVGQQVTGTIKRIADFGAFVDIGVGRDGLIHISELSVRRVGKVTDVLAEGQEVTAWIKKLDRDRNRISLTLIDPNTKTIRDLNKDDLVQGTVTRILPYGAFVDIGIGRDALLHVREMGVGYVAKPEDVVKVGDVIEARIIELSRRRGRVDLSLKGLRDEPEPPAPAQQTPADRSQYFAQGEAYAQAQAQSQSSRRQAEPEPEEEEDFEDLEVLSPMELAFKRAMEAEGMELNISKKKQGKRNRRDRNRSLQDEIISRTLSSGRK